MGFIEEIAKKAGQIVCPWRITWMQNTCYMEGVSRVLCISQTKIQVQTAGGNFSFVGEGLFLCAYADGDVAIRGTILRVERV